MDFKALAQNAVTVTVDGEQVVLRAPTLTVRGEIWKKLSDIRENEDNVSSASVWTECVAMALQDTVVTDDPMSLQDWSRVITLNDVGKAPEGLAELVSESLKLFGLSSEVREPSDAAGVRDNAQEAADQLGE